MRAICVQGGRGGQKGPKNCMHTISMAPYKTQPAAGKKLRIGFFNAIAQLLTKIARSQYVIQFSQQCFFPFPVYQNFLDVKRLKLRKKHTKSRQSETDVWKMHPLPFLWRYRSRVQYIVASRCCCKDRRPI